MPASGEVCQKAYREILRTGRRFAGSEDEARDLTQDAVVIALARDFDDGSAPGRRGSLRGVFRKRAAFVVRGEVRRCRREQLLESASGSGATSWVSKAVKKACCGT